MKTNAVMFKSPLYRKIICIVQALWILFQAKMCLCFRNYGSHFTLIFTIFEMCIIKGQNEDRCFMFVPLKLHNISLKLHYVSIKMHDIPLKLHITSKYYFLS